MHPRFNQCRSPNVVSGLQHFTTEKGYRWKLFGTNDLLSWCLDSYRDVTKVQSRDPDNTYVSLHTNPHSPCPLGAWCWHVTQWPLFSACLPFPDLSCCITLSTPFSAMSLQMTDVQRGTMKTLFLSEWLWTLAFFFSMQPEQRTVQHRPAWWWMHVVCPKHLAMIKPVYSACFLMLITCMKGTKWQSVKTKETPVYSKHTTTVVQTEA